MHILHYVEALRFQTIYAYYDYFKLFLDAIRASLFPNSILKYYKGLSGLINVKIVFGSICFPVDNLELSQASLIIIVFLILL